MAALDSPTSWQCHLCDSGPHFCAITTTCPGVVFGAQCGHVMCQQCKTDLDIPLPLSFRDLDWNTESRRLAFNNQAGRSIQDSAQTDVLPNAHSAESPDPSQNQDEDHLRGGITERIPDDVSIISSSFGGVPDVDLWGTVTGNSTSESRHQQFPFPSLDLSSCCFNLSCR
jgi:hypothetical protein